MKAVRIHSFGGSDLLTYEEAPLPILGENDALIQVKAASINPVDVAFRMGYMNAYIPISFPATLGVDVAGTVEAIGSAVTNLKVGDAVYARTDLSRLGGYAEYVAITAEEVVLKPPSLNFIQAAAIPQAAVTTWRSLIDAANLQAGQTILIHAASGGVGSIAVQFAKTRGAYVIGTASAGNQEFLKELGVDEAVDYTAGPFEDKIKNVDVVFDTIGGDTLARSFKVLKPGGILISIVEPPSAESAAAYGVRIAMVGGYPPNAPVLKEFSKLIEAGKIKPFVSTILPLAGALQGQDLIAARHTRGKIVMQV